MAWLLLALLTAYVATDATAQGKLAWLTREWVPPTAQGQVSIALHWLYPACYALLAMAMGLLANNWRWLAVAALVRLALFDPVFCWSRGDRIFSIGSSAVLDRLLAAVAGARASVLSAVLRAAALAGAIGVVTSNWIS